MAADRAEQRRGEDTDHGEAETVSPVRERGRARTSEGDFKLGELRTGPLDVVYDDWLRGIYSMTPTRHSTQALLPPLSILAHGKRLRATEGYQITLVGGAGKKKLLS
ncbi:hypothetical protein NDU88_009411 [Pleurodeles waltl]|uniref:Uncharacterized protein n=1 Tax=Pleurodeles waltl TaxID=8319 RepID=A0AAV7QSZ1_PLEWA|nr:hypothetical protein NDU88_009411 [Pleurodeles waltl]